MGTDQIEELRIGAAGPFEAALYWLIAFYPSISADGAEDGVMVLRSSLLSRSQMEDAWACALANERLLAGNAEDREAVLSTLVS